MSTIGTNQPALAKITQSTDNTVTFHIDLPKDLPKATAQPTRPQTVRLEDKAS